ncbi:unnamed protein product [Leptosia nina]|uniref:DUF4781 domain-containing protein n=1 Tax=Leptosia nina TaxID=320188 RepID=A0AAV1JFB0_9NEOP
MSTEHNYQNGTNPTGDDVMAENPTPVQIQQEYFENLSDCDWVAYNLNCKSDRSYLMQNVAFALFGSPTIEGDLNAKEVLEGYTSRQKEQAQEVYKKICEQKKYSQDDETIMISILLVVCARPKPLKLLQFRPSNYWMDLHKKTDILMWSIPVFKVRKCISFSDEKPCSVFIDDNARVYKDWNSYLTNNTLPKCVIVAPCNGIYDGVLVEEDKSIAVKLTVTPSPALGLSSQVLSSVDTASTVVSFGAAGVLGVALFTPVAPVLLAGATVATVSAGIYGLVRSSIHLHDRRQHEQSINVTNPEARGSWINITASSVGLAAGAASSLLARSAVAGNNLTKVGQMLTVSVDILRHANLATGAVGVLNGLIHLIVKYHKHGEKATKLELFQFSASLLFFFQAAVSNRTAQNIIEDAQANTINEYRATLRSNKHRKIFDKISAEARRVAGTTVQGNTEVITGIKNIANKDQYFADVLRINKDINQHKLRISLTSDGKVNLNAAHKFDPSQLSGLGRDGRAELFSSLGPSKLKTPNVSTKVGPTSSPPMQSFGETEEKYDEIPKKGVVGIRPEEIIQIGVYLVRVSTSGTENITKLLENLSKDVYDGVMTVSMNIISNLIPEDIARMKILNPNKDLLQQIIEFVFNYLKHDRPLGEVSFEDDNSIVIVLKSFFQDGALKRDILLKLKERLLKNIEVELDRQRRQFPNKIQISCTVCKGVRYENK